MTLRDKRRSRRKLDRRLDQHRAAYREFGRVREWLVAQGYEIPEALATDYAEDYIVASDTWREAIVSTPGLSGLSAELIDATAARAFSEASEVDL